jgi:hypothetical protein
VTAVFRVVTDRFGIVTGRFGHRVRGVAVFVGGLHAAQIH